MAWVQDDQGNWYDDGTAGADPETNPGGPPNNPGVPQSPPAPRVGTPDDPDYSGGTPNVDPWGRGPSDPDYGYPPGAPHTNTPSPTTPPPPQPPPGQPQPRSSGSAIDPSYLAPWTGVFDPGADAALPTYTAPSPFSYADWQAPDPSSITKDPSYQWRVNQGAGALENSAAAKGVLNSGGTLGDILSYGQNFASNEYNNVFNRDLTKYTTNRNNAVDTYATNYGVGKDTYGLLKGRSDDAYDRAWKQYQDQEDVWYKNQNAPFSKLSTLLGYGQTAAAHA